MTEGQKLTPEILKILRARTYAYRSATGSAPASSMVSLAPMGSVDYYVDFGCTPDEARTRSAAYAAQTAATRADRAKSQAKADEARKKREDEAEEKRLRWAAHIEGPRTDLLIAARKVWADAKVTAASDWLDRPIEGDRDLHVEFPTGVSFEQLSRFVALICHDRVNISAEPDGCITCGCDWFTRLIVVDAIPPLDK